MDWYDINDDGWLATAFGDVNADGYFDVLPDVVIGDFTIDDPFGDDVADDPLGLPPEPGGDPPMDWQDPDVMGGSPESIDPTVTLGDLENLSSAGCEYFAARPW